MDSYGLNSIGFFKIESVPTLPVFTSEAADKRRVIYCEDTQLVYYASATAWAQFGSGSSGLTPNTISTTPTTLTAEQCASFVHYVTYMGDAVINLADVTSVEDNSLFICYMQTPYVLTIDPYITDRIILNGVALVDGYKVVSGGGIGNYITFHKDSADGWTVLGRSGLWTDGGA